MQGCRAHMLRDAEHRAPEDDPGTRLPYDGLRLPYHGAKGTARPCDRKTVPGTESRCHAIPDTYERNGAASGEKLRRAVPDPLAFLRYPGTGPAGSGPGRMLRRAAIRRRMRRRTATDGGTGVLGIPMSCARTWQRLGPDVTKQIQSMA